MAKMINITCTGCETNFVIEPYFCNTYIYTKEHPIDKLDHYIARTTAKATCPYCGKTSEQVCENEIYPRNIIDLAVQKYHRG